MSEKRYNQVGIDLINALYDRDFDRSTAEGILVFSKTPSNWEIILEQLNLHPEFDSSQWQLFALALGETV